MIKIIISDFDGVILESNNAKTRAFEQCFSDYPDKIDQILSYHQNNLATSRYQKFEYIHQTILGIDYDKEQKEITENRFHNIVVAEVTKCSAVPGAIDFLQTYSKHVPILIVSATPLDELNLIIQNKGLSEYISETFSTTGGKAGIIKTILDTRAIRPSEAVYIGDTNGDLDAAAKIQVPFIGRKDCETFDGPMNCQVNDLTTIRQFLKINHNTNQGITLHHD